MCYAWHDDGQGVKVLSHRLVGRQTAVFEAMPKRIKKQEPFKRNRH